MTFPSLNGTVLVAVIASIVVRFGDVQSMAWGSDAVVHGMVTDVNVERDHLGRIMTWTELTVLDARSAAGHPVARNESLWLAQLGGTLQGETFSVPGTTEFVVGDELVLCVVAMNRWPGVVIPHTLGAGVFRVQGSLGEIRGDIVDSAGRVSPARVIDDLETFWLQTGLSGSELKP